MKKYPAVLFLVIMIIPSVTMAAWWKPRTWKVFQRKIVPVENNVNILTDQITPTQSAGDLKNSDKENLKKELESLKKQISSDKQKNIILPTVSSPSASVKVTAPEPVWDVCKNIEGVQSIAPEGMRADNGNCFQIPKDVPVTVNTQNTSDQNAEAAKKQALAVFQAECTSSINKLKQQILDIKTQYYIDLDKLNASFANSGATSNGVQPMKEGLRRVANKKITDINIQIEQKLLDCGF